MPAKTKRNPYGMRYHNGALRTDSDGNVWSYATCLAVKISDDAFILNETRYSLTTSKHQSEVRYVLRMLFPKARFYSVKDLNRGATNADILGAFVGGQRATV